MANSVANPRIKAFVLLNEEEYLKENIRNPDRYFHSLKKHNILTEEQCQEIKNISDIKDRIVRLVELISSHRRGFDVFSTITRKSNVDIHIASHLSKKVSEAALLLESPAYNLELSVEQQQRLKLLDFLEHFHIRHDVAEDILQNMRWDLESALKAARNMGLREEQKGTGSPSDISPRLSNGSSMCDSDEFCFSPGSSTNSSARSSASDLLPNNDGGYGGYHSEVGRLPRAPPITVRTPISPVTNGTEFHPGHGPLPWPPQSPATSDPTRNDQVPKNSARATAPPTSDGRSSPEHGTYPHTSSPVKPPSRPLPPSTSAAASDSNASKSSRPTTLPTAKRHPVSQADARTRAVAETKPEAQPCKSKKDEAVIGRNSSPASPVEKGDSQAWRSSGPTRHVCIAPDLTPEAHIRTPQKIEGEGNADRLASFTTTPKTPISISLFSETGPYWVCYHCNEPNMNDHVMCSRCNMLYCHTHPSWDADDDSESVNYICMTCTLPVRIPCKPCPPTLVSCLRTSRLCNKCYRASCHYREETSCRRQILATKPTLLQLGSMQEEDGHKICIMDEVASQWDSLAPQLGIPSSQINILHRDCAMQCCTATRRMFSTWVDGADATWKQLLDGLRIIDQDVLAKRIEQVCRYVIPQEK